MKTTKMMTDSWIDVGQPSKKSATTVDEAAFPIKNLFKKLYTLASMKVEAVDSIKFKKEEAAEAIYEKMKDLEVKKKAEESQSSDSVAAGRFMAFVGGLGTSAKDTDKALRQHFENCGGIEGISVDDQFGCAYINFTSLESLLKALQLNGTSFRGHRLNIYRKIAKKSTFRATIDGLRTGTGARKLDVLLALIDHFKICGEIEGICSTSPGFVDIDFASLASRDKALEFNNTKFRDHLITVTEEFSCMGIYRAEIRGFDTGADAEKVEEALRKHFKECGRIEGISANAGRAYIDFASRVSLFKGLELNNTEVDGHPITVRQPGTGCLRTSQYKAIITWSSYIDPDALRSHFEMCGGVAGISYISFQNVAMIYFTNLVALENALKLDGSFICNNPITVGKCISDAGASG